MIPLAPWLPRLLKTTDQSSKVALGLAVLVALLVCAYILVDLAWTLWR